MFRKIEQSLVDKSTTAPLVLKSEVVLQSPLQDNIHEGQVSSTHGFVPFDVISPSLPPAYQAWEMLSKNLPRYISEGSERKHIRQLPLLDANNVEKLPNQYLSRALAMLGNFAHIYYFNQRLGTNQTTDPLPAGVLIPWQQLTKRIHRQLPPDIDEIQAVRLHYDTFLTNWNLNNADIRIDGEHNSEIKIHDLTILSPIFGNSAEFNFNMTFVIMELRFARALPQITHAIKAVARHDEEALIRALKEMTEVIEDVTEGLDYINPNMHSDHHVDQTVWTKTVAKIDGKIPGGVSALSGSAMPLFHTLDTFIERETYASTMGEAMMKKFNHQPAHVKKYLSALREDLQTYSIKHFVTNSNNQKLRNAYDLLINAYLSEHGLMGIHAVKVYGYMKINFRNGRLMTNGGHDGTSTIATEPQRDIVDDFALADAERLGAYQPCQQYALRLNMHSYGNKATSLVLDVSHTALYFKPGDHCGIYPQNSTSVVQEVLNQYGLNPRQETTLNKTWQTFFSRRAGHLVTNIELETLLTHADLRVSLNPLTLLTLKPLTPRYYSVSPLPTFPQHIQLTVGMHPQGITSTYLTSEATVFAIDRIPSRHFHLPKRKDTPILMFAAGTGISPFMGFISERAGYADSSKNYLFFSMTDVNAFYHQDVLGKAVADNTLNLSVIFSRGEGYNTGEFTSDGFVLSSKYSGRHVDQLIDEQAKAIADLIVHQQAKIYVCGNPGFANTVRTSIINALRAYSDIINPCDYVDTMMADFRFNNEVYSVEQSAQFPSFYASEIARHNTMDDCWGVINGNVYNLTRFIHTHPGGAKIVMVNAGMDMSGDYNYVKHNQMPHIQGQLQQYKIGVMASPTLHETKTVVLHQKAKRFVEALTEIENTLRNNSIHHKQKDEVYLWREVFSVFVSGSLASYKSNTAPAGSLSYVMGTLFDELCKVADSAPTLHYSVLMASATACADYIRQSSLGHLSEEVLNQKKQLVDSVLAHTFEFISHVKNLALSMLSEIEINAEGYNVALFIESLEMINQEMQRYSLVLEHTIQYAPEQKQSITTIPTEISVGCPFMHHEGMKEPMKAIPIGARVCPFSNTNAINQFGLMATKLKQEVVPEVVQEQEVVKEEKTDGWALSDFCPIM